MLIFLSIDINGEERSFIDLSILAPAIKGRTSLIESYAITSTSEFPLVSSCPVIGTNANFVLLKTSIALLRANSYLQFLQNHHYLLCSYF